MRKGLKITLLHLIVFFGISVILWICKYQLAALIIYLILKYR